MRSVHTKSNTFYSLAENPYSSVKPLSFYGRSKKKATKSVSKLMEKSAFKLSPKMRGL